MNVVPVFNENDAISKGVVKATVCLPSLVYFSKLILQGSICVQAIQHLSYSCATFLVFLLFEYQARVISQSHPLEISLVLGEVKDGRIQRQCLPGSQEDACDAP